MVRDQARVVAPRPGPASLHRRSTRTPREASEGRDAASVQSAESACARVHACVFVHVREAFRDLWGHWWPLAAPPPPPSLTGGDPPQGRQIHAAALPAVMTTPQNRETHNIFQHKLCRGVTTETSAQLLKPQPGVSRSEWTCCSS